MNDKNSIFLNSTISARPSKKLSRLIAKELQTEDPAEGLQLIEDLFKDDEKEIRIHESTNTSDNSKNS